MPDAFCFAPWRGSACASSASACRRSSGCPHSCRSEEHTSELQSLMRISYAVFCLKKKKNQQQQSNSTPLQQNECQMNTQPLSKTIYNTSTTCKSNATGHIN